MTKWMTTTDHRKEVAKIKRAERKKRQRLQSKLATAKRERKKYWLEAARHRNGKEAADAENAHLKEENAWHKAMWSTRREGVPEWEMGDAPADPGALRAHVGEVLDAILRDKNATRDVSGLAKEKFDFVLRRFEEKANTNGGKSPLFYGARRRDHEKGTRMLLPLRHILLMTLAGKSEGNSQYFLSAMFGVSRPTVGRCMAFADSILGAILPTADRVSWKLSHAKTRKEFKQLVPGPGLGIVLIDGFQTERQRPQDKEERKASFGTKFQMHAFSTLACTNKRGGVLWLGPTRHGRVHDKGSLNMRSFTFGKWTAEIREEYVDPEKRFTLIGDTAFVAMEKMFPGQRVLLPVKRKPGKDLTDEELEWNKYVGSRRIYVEHGIGALKQFKILQHPFRGSNKKYRRQLNIVSGLANLNMFWPIIKKDAWIGRKL